MVPLKINGKTLYSIFDPDTFNIAWSDREIELYSIENNMYPTEVALISETYSRDAERTADYELEDLTLVNRKAKPEFTWTLIKATYVENLLKFLGYTYEFKNASGDVIPVKAPEIQVTYHDFIGERTIKAYLAQTIEGTLVCYNDILYWQNFRIAFPER